jgi:uncharacterized protein (TIRG00374 family)
MEFLRRRLGLIFRALVSLLFVYLVARSADWEKVWSNVRTMDVHWLLAGFLVFSPVLLITSWRWRLLLGVHGVHLPYWRIFELNMIGQFFSAFLVGTTGGDFVKIFYVARAVPHHKAAVAFTVVVDRVVGLIAMLFFGVVLSFTQLPLLLSHPYTRFFTGIFYLFAVGGLVASVGATVAPYFLKRPAIRDFFKRLPLAHRASSVFSAYERTARSFTTNLTALLVSIPSNMCIVFMGYCIMRAMHLQPPLLAFCSILTMVNMLIALPISIAGLGVREQLFKTFLALVLIDKDHAFTFSITFFVLNLAWSLVGGLFYLMYRNETHTPAPHVTEDASLLSQV